MCLKVYKNSVPKLAEKNITVFVFRCVSKRRNGTTRIDSPFQYTSWEMRKTKKLKSKKFRIMNYYNDYIGARVDYIGSGAFHSFKTKTATKNVLNSHFYERAFEAIIPKGTLYISGTVNLGNRSKGYASKALKLVKMIKEK